MIVAGLDPGKNGALVTLFEDGSTVVNRVPLIQRAPKPGRKTSSKVPDEREWARRWRQQIFFSNPDLFVVEAVHGWKGQAAGASFAFGRAMGFAMATIMYIDVPIHGAPPNVWKERFGLVGMPKSASIDVCRKLIPSLAPELTKAKDEGVAEAGLLAYYGLMTVSEG